MDTKALLKLIVTEIPDIWRQYVKDAIAGVKDVPLEEVYHIVKKPLEHLWAMGSANGLKTGRPGGGVPSIRPFDNPSASDKIR